MNDVFSSLQRTRRPRCVVVQGWGDPVQCGFGAFFHISKKKLWPSGTDSKPDAGPVGRTKRFGGAAVFKTHYWIRINQLTSSNEQRHVSTYRGQGAFAEIISYLLVEFNAAAIYVVRQSSFKLTCISASASLVDPRACMGQSQAVRFRKRKSKVEWPTRI